MNSATFCDMWARKQPEMMPFGPIKVFEPPFHGCPPPPPYSSACGIDYLELCKMAGNSAKYTLKG